MNTDSLQGGFTHDPGVYLNRVGDFLRGLPVEHSVLSSNAARRAQLEQINEADLWLWVEAGNQVVAAAPHATAWGVPLDWPERGDETAGPDAVGAAPVACRRRRSDTLA